jgi:hypothetical protein
MTTPASVSAPTRPAATVRNRRTLVVAGAALAPTAVWLVAQATGHDLEVSLAGQPPMVVSLPFVVVTALVASLAGWGALAVLQRVTSHARTLWTGLAVAALIVSFGPVATVETNAAARTFLALMHVAVAAVLVPGLRGTLPARAMVDTERRQS